jgi:predicted transcriptional regulator
MAQNANIQKTVIATDETFDVQNMFNKAIFGILVSKEIVTEEEMIVILGKINSVQDTYYEATK